MSALAAASTARSTSARASRISTATRSWSTRSTAAMRRGPQPVPADGRRAGAARGGRRQDRGAVRPPLRPGERDHRSPPARRRPSSPRSSPCVHPGDEVIVLEPCYDSYEPEHRAGRRRRVVHVPLTPGTLPARLRRASPPRSRRARARSSSTRRTTRAPPSGRATTCSGWPRCWRPTDVLRDQRRGLRAHGVRRRSSTRASRAFPSWRRAAFVVSSFGKTYHVTGWKVGYVAAPAALTAEFRKVHQFNVFTVNTPMQHGLAALHGRPGALPRAAGLLPAQARPVPRRPGADAAASCCPARAATSSASTTRRSATGARPISAAG